MRAMTLDRQSQHLEVDLLVMGEEKLSMRPTIQRIRFLTATMKHSIHVRLQFSPYVQHADLL